MSYLEGRTLIERLAAIDRESCSAGELEAAELLATALRDHVAEVQIERPRVHGTYWWPLGLTSAAGALAAVAAGRGKRRLALALGGLATAAVVDDLNAGRRVLRRLLPKRRTANVLAWTGDARAAHTLIVVAHHDAAHTGVFFNPGISEGLARRLHWAAEVEGPPVMLPVVVGPALAGAGALTGLRRVASLGGLVCLGIIASMANIATSRTVPGANDNLSGVATIVELARRLRSRPVRGLRVLLLSTGAEEALMEGMHGFAARHLAGMDPTTTHVLCVDSVGSPHLVLAAGQGMLRVHPHDAGFDELIGRCADEAGMPLRRGMQMRLGTDGYLALRHGFPTALLMSVNDFGVSSNYHWPSDTPDRVDYATLGDACELCERVVRRLAETVA